LILTHFYGGAGAITANDRAGINGWLDHGQALFTNPDQIFGRNLPLFEERDDDK